MNFVKEESDKYHYFGVMAQNKKIIKYAIQILIVLFGVSFLTFCLIYIAPGDPAQVMLTECGLIPTPELLAHTRAELGIDKPFYIPVVLHIFVSFTVEVAVSDFNRFPY